MPARFRPRRWENQHRSDLEMGCDMVVALGQATADGHTLFGQNCSRPAQTSQPMCRTPGRAFAPGEKVRTEYLEIPQARQTFTVLGSQPPGCWGYQHGVNERGVAAGFTVFRNKLLASRPGLSGTDLIRLILERAHSACQAIDVLAGLLELHGHGACAGNSGDIEGDHAFLIADASEAFLVETADGYWVYQEIEQVRAASDVCTIRQDWNRIAPGLSGQAIDKGWWPGDGSKLNFADALSDNPVGEASALRRWGRATLLLEEQNGHIDEPFLRRLLCDHYEGTHFEVDPLKGHAGPLPLCQHAGSAGGMATAASMVAALGRPERLLVAGCAFGPPCLGVYFPIFLEGELPAPFTRGGAEPAAGCVAEHIHRLNDQIRAEPEIWNEVHDRLAQLQADLDHESEDFARQGFALKLRGEQALLDHRVGAFMQHGLERFEAVLAEFITHQPLALHAHGH